MGQGPLWDSRNAENSRNHPTPLPNPHSGAEISQSGRDKPVGVTAVRCPPFTAKVSKRLNGHSMSSAISRSSRMFGELMDARPCQAYGPLGSWAG